MYLQTYLELACSTWDEDPDDQRPDARRIACGAAVGLNSLTATQFGAAAESESV